MANAKTATTDKNLATAYVEDVCKGIRERFTVEKCEGYMGSVGFEGCNSGSFLGATELAATVRKQLKDNLPLAKSAVSVRKHSYSGGRSLYVTLKLPQEWKKKDVSPYSTWNGTRDRVLDEVFEPEGIAVIRATEAIVNSYNYNHSNGMVDYFSAGFYWHLKIA
jgi:hypothetical protein